ncbi:hypothetical protein HanIR_Chr16g0819591 [Helianthus annuus]|nr:hypothetical protein HanIR_Chr16g0819591 [Helianthus annuus]
MQIMVGVSRLQMMKHTRHISPILNAGATQSFDNNTDLEKNFAGYISKFVDIQSPMAVGVAISLDIGESAMQFPAVDDRSIIAANFAAEASPESHGNEGSPSIVEEIEAKLRDADLCRQVAKFYSYS